MGLYPLLYRALSETKYAALAQVSMHGREDVVVVRNDLGWCCIPILPVPEFGL
jgi:hypothetical protein